MGKRKRRN